MQNHIDNNNTNRSVGGVVGSFTGMLSSNSSDPCFSGDSHDFSNINGSNNNNNNQDYSIIYNQQQQHTEETNNNSTNHNHNNTNNSFSKPKKVPPPNGKKTKGRVKIKMEFIDNKLRRYTTFSKRKTGIMKKAYELSTLTGTQVMLLVASETGHVYTFATRKLQPMITSEAGKALIQTCLNSPDPPNIGDTQRMSATGYEETELTYAADPNGSEHGGGESKDDDSDSFSSECDDVNKSVPGLLPISLSTNTNPGIISPNFSSLFGNTSGGGGVLGFSGGKGFGNFPPDGISPPSSSQNPSTSTQPQQSQNTKSIKIKKEIQ